MAQQSNRIRATLHPTFTTICQSSRKDISSAKDGGMNTEKTPLLFPTSTNVPKVAAESQQTLLTVRYRRLLEKRVKGWLRNTRYMFALLRSSIQPIMRVLPSDFEVTFEVGDNPDTGVELLVNANTLIDTSHPSTALSLKLGLESLHGIISIAFIRNRLPTLLQRIDSLQVPPSTIRLPDEKVLHILGVVEVTWVPNAVLNRIASPNIRSTMTCLVVRESRHDLVVGDAGIIEFHLWQTRRAGEHSEWALTQATPGT
jgi:hypothetical protein